MDLGPEHGTLTLHTTRAGAAAKVGHDLTLRFTTWSAQQDSAGALTFQVELRSLVVIAGEGGVKGLTEKDKETILGNALKCIQADKHPLASVRVENPPKTSATIEGQVRIAGVTHAVPLHIEISGTNPSHVVTGTITQTDFGIKPYSGLLGALKVADDVAVRLELSI